MLAFVNGYFGVLVTWILVDGCGLLLRVRSMIALKGCVLMVVSLIWVFRHLHCVLVVVHQKFRVESIHWILCALLVVTNHCNLSIIAFRQRCRL